MKSAALLIILISTLFSVGCARTNVKPSSSAGALTTNTAVNNGVAAKPFAKHTLGMGGSSFLNEFLRADVRAKLDEEPTGDADAGFDPSTSEPGYQDAPPGEGSGDAAGQSADSGDAAGADESNGAAHGIDTLKFVWARKAFGDAVKANPENNGVIVLYADENYYDVNRMMGLIEEGRNRIVQMSDIPGDRIQVVFGGYRAVPQVELWVVTETSGLPELRPDDRSQNSQAEN